MNIMEEANDDKIIVRPGVVSNQNTNMLCNVI